MAQFLDIFGFLSVLLRGLVLTFEALTVGGVIFLAAVAAPAGVGVPRLRTLLTWCALLLAAVECCTVAATSAILVGSTDISWADAAGAQFAIAGMLVVLGALAVASTARGFFPAIGCLLILCGSVMNSHSVSRLDHRWLLVALTLAHHVAGAAWIGGAAIGAPA